MTFFRDEWEWRRDLERGEGAHLAGSTGDVFAEKAQNVAGVFELVEHRATVDVLDGVELELKGGDHSKVAAAASDRPEEIFVLLFARDNEFAVGGDDIGRDEVVTREAIPAGKVADTAAQGQTADAGGRDDATGAGQPESVGGRVEVAPGGAAFRAGRAPLRVDANAAHAGQVDHDPFVNRSEARHAVRASPDRKIQSSLAREIDRRHHVARVGGPHDDLRTLVDHSVPHLARLVIALVIGGDDVTPDLLAKLVYRECDHSAASSLYKGRCPPSLPLPVPVTV